MYGRADRAGCSSGERTAGRLGARADRPRCGYVCANADGSVSFAREPWGAENGGRHQAVSAPAWEGWTEKPPVGTEALLGCGFVEIHVGRWIWQTVSASGA